jgi:hypothetical protein
MTHIKLCYRGASYEYSVPCLEPTSQQIVGHYRGAVWRSPCFKAIASPAPVVVLQYRGVLYNSGNSPSAWTGIANSKLWRRQRSIAPALK